MKNDEMMYQVVAFPVLHRIRNTGINQILISNISIVVDASKPAQTKCWWTNGGSESGNEKLWETRGESAVSQRWAECKRSEFIVFLLIVPGINNSTQEMFRIIFRLLLDFQLLRSSDQY